MHPASKPENWPISKIVPYPGNPRSHSSEQITLLAKLMLRHGIDQPIVVDEAGVIIKGHGRRLAAIEAGFDAFPTEYLLILQKEPKAAKGTWHNNSLRDWHSEKSDRDSHPHAKPPKLTRALIETMTRKGDLVVDPCAGSFGVLSACRLTGREFVGCDLAR